METPGDSENAVKQGNGACFPIRTDRKPLWAGIRARYGLWGHKHMNRFALGGLAALLLAASGMFWWQGRAEMEAGVPPPDAAGDAEFAEGPAAPDPLPSADVRGQRGPAPPEATEMSREQRRFGRYDRDSDGRVTRNEMLSTRTAAFRKLDADGNNLLTFEEWAAATANRFRAADSNGDLWLSPVEFRATKPKEQAPPPRCRC